jgi:hypothetical protein
MAPTLTNTFEQNFAKVLTKLLGQRAVFMAVRGREAEVSLHANGGKTYTYLNLTEGTSQDYTPYTDAAIDNFTVNPSTLNLETRTMYTFPWDEFDSVVHQANTSIVESNLGAARKKLERDMSGEFFGKAAGLVGANKFDEADLQGGATSGNLTWAVSNIPAILTESRAKVRDLSGESGGDFMIVTPKQSAIIEQSHIANGFKVSDEALMRGIQPGMNGFLGKLYGVDVYECDFVPHSYTLTYTDQPGNTNTLVLDGVTILAETTTATAGSFDISTTDDLTYANLVTLINNPLSSVAGNTTAFSAANARIIRGWYAVQNTTAKTVTLYKKWGSGTATETLANATLGTQVVENIMGKYGALELAMWKAGIQMVKRPEPKQTRENYLVYSFFGVAQPLGNRNRWLKLRVDA